MRALFLGLCLAALAAPAAALECAVKSGPWTTALIELYTSEGCSSCPPADRWLSHLREAGFGANRVVPLAFHVDYWDSIGWKDPFARPAFSARQRELAAVSGAGFVYTPQVLLAGRNYRRWMSSESFERDVRAVNGHPARADIALAFHARVVTTTAKVTDSERSPEAALFVAVFENGLSSEVAAGENRGVTLRHDYVVREWLGPLAVAGTRPVELSHRVTVPHPSGVAAFVQDSRTGEVLQAVMCGQ